MIRRTPVLAVAALCALAGCSGDDGDPSTASATTEAAPTSATLPDGVEPGRGALVLDGHATVLTVTSCALEPATDPTTGVTTELAVAADDGTGLTVDLARSSFTADVPSVTDTVVVVDESGAELESSRVDRDGLLIDLRLPNPVGPLIDVDAEAGIVRAEGVFGPPNATADDPGNVDGSLLLRCP